MVKYLTPEGYEKLNNELNKLKNVERKKIAQRLKKAVAYGDLSENADYIQAREDQGLIENRIAEIENLLKNSTIVDKKNIGVVQIGSVVTLKNGVKERKFKIVGSQEADPSDDKISFESPLGKSLMNKYQGEEVQIKTPRGKTRYKILKIE